MNPVVTIITPTYNHELYIKECIESVLSQTIDDWEMIIVDDGSTDNTPNIVQHYDDPSASLLYHKKPRPLGVVRVQRLCQLNR